MTNINYSSESYLKKVDAYWRATNYISVGQLYLKGNPLLREPLKPEHVKNAVFGHWGTIAGQNFIYAHLNRVINKYDLSMLYISGPGHGGQVMVSNSYLDGSYSEVYPEITQDLEGLSKLYKQFSFSGGIGSHATPQAPGSIHEGGELGYSLVHGFGAILDNPDLIATVVVGDGEAETGPLATSWQLNKFINPVTDGVVLPILYLNGFKISNPTIMAKMTDEELQKYFEGLGWDPIFVEGNEPEVMHQLMAEKMDEAIEKILTIKKHALEENDMSRPKWPVILNRTPKGWTGPKELDGKPIEGSFRAHQVPIPFDSKHMECADDFVKWMNTYGPEELFTEDGKLVEEIAEIIPKGDRRMSCNPATNGGKIMKGLRLPDYREYAIDNKEKGKNVAQDMLILGKYVRDVMKLNDKEGNFRVFSPDEAASNRLYAMFEETKRQWVGEIDEPYDEFLAPDGRILDSMLSEHIAEGALEAYLLTGRHGFIHSYESFLRVVDSMITQHFKWLNQCEDIPWRADIPSLNLINTSHIWQQDHNGYTHQDPGMLGHLADKNSGLIHEYLPADANTLLVTFDKCIRSINQVNVMTASKHPRQQWFTIEEAEYLVNKGLGIVDWASTDKNGETDIVFAMAGDTPTLEGLAAVQLLHDYLPDLKIRFVNIVDLLKLQSPEVYEHGISDEEFNMIFTKDKPIIFGFHGYENLVDTLFFKRDNHNVSVHGYRDKGEITTGFDMRVMNELDRFNLVKDAIYNLPQLGNKGAHIIQEMNEKLEIHTKFVHENGIDLPEIANWQWKGLK